MMRGFARLRARVAPANRAGLVPKTIGAGIAAGPAGRLRVLLTNVAPSVSGRPLGRCLMRPAAVMLVPSTALAGAQVLPHRDARRIGLDRRTGSPARRWSRSASRPLRGFEPGLGPGPNRRCRPCRASAFRYRQAEDRLQATSPSRLPVPEPFRCSPTCWSSLRNPCLPALRSAGSVLREAERDRRSFVSPLSG